MTMLSWTSRTWARICSISWQGAENKIGSCTEYRIVYRVFTSKSAFIFIYRIQLFGFENEQYYHQQFRNDNFFLMPKLQLCFFLPIILYISMQMNLYNEGTLFMNYNLYTSINLLIQLLVEYYFHSSNIRSLSIN